MGDNVQLVNSFLIQSGTAEKQKFKIGDTQTNRIDFRYAYAKPPLIQIGLVGFDDWNGGQVRLMTETKVVHTHYFEVLISTWWSSKIWLARIQWTAFGEAANGVLENGIEPKTIADINPQPFSFEVPKD